LVLGPIQLRYYGLVFWLTCIVAYGLWVRHMKDGGYPKKTASGFLWIGLVWGLVGARLSAVLFYRPAWYFTHPSEIIRIWHGGLSSHGGTLGVLLGLIYHARRTQIPALDLTDRFAPSAAVIAIGIRIANFLNSEIVGRPTSLPWGIRFVHFSDGGTVPRHPTQIYAAILGLGVLLLLEATHSFCGKRPPKGLLTAMFLFCYFGGRFWIEFTKEYLTPIDDFLTMGQWLSILPMLCGLELLILAAARRGQSAISEGLRQ
jgi:phosphatidylglycerol:prolipoprotein diacylglycerol transferase